MNELINQIVPLLVTCILGILAVVIKAVGDVTIKFLQAKKEEAIARLGQVEYEKRMATAQDIWGVVDEHFRVHDLINHTVNDKIDLFNKLLLERIPSLKQSDLDYLRQAIAGQINAGKGVLQEAPEGEE